MPEIDGPIFKPIRSLSSQQHAGPASMDPNKLRAGPTPADVPNTAGGSKRHGVFDEGFTQPVAVDLFGIKREELSQAAATMASASSQDHGRFRFQLPAPESEAEQLAEIADFYKEPDPEEPKPASGTREPSSEEIARRAFVHAKLEFEKTYEDTISERTLIAWRLLREIARTQTLIDYHETLEEALSAQDNLAALGEGADPWVIGHTVTKAMAVWQGRTTANKMSGIKTTAGGPKLCMGAVRLMARADALPKHQQSTYYNALQERDEPAANPDPEGEPIKLFGVMHIEPGLPLLPPAIATEWLDEYQQPRPGYSEEADVLLVMYVDVLAEIAQHMGMMAGSKDNKDLGRNGLRGLLDAKTVRVAMPSRLLIIGMELILVDEMLKNLVNFGHMTAREKMQQKYGFTTIEVEQLGQMAKRRAEAITKGELEEERSLMILRTEGLIRRAQTAFDVRTEFMALKQLAIIHGLGKEEDDKGKHGDYLAVIKKVANEAGKRTVIGEAPMRSLPA